MSQNIWGQILEPHFMNINKGLYKPISYLELVEILVMGLRV